MAPRLLALALCLCFLCGCAPISMNTDDLLEPPRLNQRQTKVEEALGATLGATQNLNSILYRYPQSGDFRSPFVFYDLDKDGLQEAIVFYAFRADTESVRAKILKEREDGSWQVLNDLSGMGEDQVDFIQFSHVLSWESECMLIGWQNTRTGQSTLEVFSFDGGVLRTEAQMSYTLHCVDDFFGDGLSEIALVRQDSTEFYQTVLLGRSVDGRLTTLGEAQLSPEINTVLQVRRGRLWSSAYAIYVDERRTDTYVATEIVQVTRMGLKSLVGEDNFEWYGRTFRSEEALSVDLRDDGLVEIPTHADLPGYVAESGMTPPLLTEYIRLTVSGGFEVAYSAVVNNDAGYLVLFPDRWRDNVTVIRRPESSEWQFYKIDPATNLPSTELLRIWVYTVGDYRDRFTYDYHLLAEKGRFQYYAYLPKTGSEPLAVTESELSMLFLLL